VQNILPEDSLHYSINYQEDDSEPKHTFFVDEVVPPSGLHPGGNLKMFS